jgi:hypothetical protein
MDGSPALQGTVSSIARGITDQDNPDGPQLLSSVNPTFELVDGGVWANNPIGVAAIEAIILQPLRGGKGGSGKWKRGSSTHSRQR